MHRDVRFTNIHVMKSNIDSGALLPPSELPAVEAAAAEILEMDSDALEGHLGELLGRSGLNRQPSQIGEDGSPKIPSLVSVWLIGQVSHAVGQQKLINLSRVENKEDLRSVSGVARLLHGALAALDSVREAS